MKFESKGKRLKEAQDKMAARDTMEDPDFLDGDDKVLTFEEEELDMEDDDNFEDTEEETIEESSQKNEADNDKFNVGDTVRVSINNIKGTIIKGLYTHNKTGKATYDIQLDDGRVIQAYKSNVKKESAQKNEAKLDRDSEINFDNVGCGFEVSKMAIAGGYALYCSGFSNNTSKNLAFAHKDLSMDMGLTQEQRKANYDALQKAKITIAKELKPLADKFDRDVAAVFAKHGFKPHKD